MKKIISILLSLTIIMAMTACGNNTDEAKNQDTQNQTQIKLIIILIKVMKIMKLHLIII